MARALRIQYPGAFYHVTCRGNERKDIFVDQEDRTVFLEMPAVSSDTYHVPILAYVLMELLYRFSRINQSQIGTVVGGVNYGAISQVMSRLQKRLDEDNNLREKFGTLRKEMTYLSRIKTPLMGDPLTLSNM